MLNVKTSRKKSSRLYKTGKNAGKKEKEKKKKRKKGCNTSTNEGWQQTIPSEEEVVVRDVMVAWPQLCCMTKWRYPIKLKWTLTYSSPTATAALERALYTVKK